MTGGPRAAAQLPAPLRVPDPAAVVERGAAWLAGYLERSGAQRLVLGISGGLDSATTALWAARAVGPERLILLSLPCHTPSGGGRPGDGSTDRARLLAGRLHGAEFQVLDVGPAVAAEAWTCGVPEVLDPERWSGPGGVVFANLQARVRAIRLRTFANVHDGLVLGTGNLSERLLGYFTLGGDEETDLEVVGELFKTEVRQIASALDVPQAILDATPTAGLLPGQTDEGELGFDYEAADRVLARALELSGGRSVERIPAPVRSRLEEDGVEGVDGEVVRRVLDRVDETAFKRASRPRFDPELR